MSELDIQMIDLLLRESHFGGQTFQFLTAGIGGIHGFNMGSQENLGKTWWGK
jgi:hypothetical protein